MCFEREREENGIVMRYVLWRHFWDLMFLILLKFFFDFGLFFWVFISSLFLHCCELKSFCYLRNRVR